MNRDVALRLVAEALPADAVVVASNGHVSRQLHAVMDRPRWFYMIGSMGLAPSIALGVAAVRPDVHCVTVDGDGNVLMALGSLATVAARAPRRFTHLCIDNGRHASTGGQRTISDRVALERVAAAAGYRWTGRAAGEDALRTLLPQALAADGPSFLLIPVAPGGLPPGTPRVEIPPFELADRVRRSLAAERHP